MQAVLSINLYHERLVRKSQKSRNLAHPLGEEYTSSALSAPCELTLR